MSQTGGSGEKASFTSLEAGGPTFTVQYNPKEFRVEKALTWQEAKNPGQSTQALQFQKGAPMTASFDLIFDTTADSPPKNVQKVWVDQLLALTNATYQPTSGEVGAASAQRPHAYTFQWGTFTMKCVIESVNVTYLMFASTGEAVRARCSVKLKQWELADFAGSGTSSRVDASKIKLVDVKGGQTLTQVASASGSDMRSVAAANGITDPMSDLTGQVLSIPSKSTAAAAASSAASSAAKSAAASASSSLASSLKSAATSAASNAASAAGQAAISALTSGNAGRAGEAAAQAALSSGRSAATGAASQAAKDALKKLF